MFLEQPLDAVIIAAFFVGGEGQNQIAGRLPPFLLQPDKVGHQNGVAVFDVAGAAAIKVAVQFRELEWIKIGRPILFEGLHYVEMSEEKNRFALAAAMQPRHKVLLVGRGAGYCCSTIPTRSKYGPVVGTSSQNVCTSWGGADDKNTGRKRLRAKARRKKKMFC
jgi:hypothetical protein